MSQRQFADLYSFYPDGQTIVHNLDGGLVCNFARQILRTNLTELVLECRGVTQGTSLEEACQRTVAHTPLWSATAVKNDPETLIGVHLDFLNAGARTILTSTYQCSFSTFERAGYTRDEAVRIMHQSVKLADIARQRFYEQHPPGDPDDGPDRVRIALSLGPYGATLSPPQEFDGFYPPPYGPQAYTASGDNRNTFLDSDDPSLEEQAIQALTQFHLDRIEVFASDDETWNAIDLIAWETIPLTREIIAIRRAVSISKWNPIRPLREKPWWLTMVFPGGRFPERYHDRSEDGFVAVQRILETALGLQNCRSKDDDFIPCSSPNAIGVNCTEIRFLPEVVSAFEHVMRVLGYSKKHFKPWLVLYPNGGDVYDPHTQMWQPAEGSRRADEWASSFGNIIDQIAKRNAWEGIFVGGCCRTGSDEIRALVKVLRSKLICD